MRTGARTLPATRDGVPHEVEVAWAPDGQDYVVTLTGAGPQPVRAKAGDAFAALCRVREQLEPLGWRIGAAGAQPDVWPSGMARDMGGGLRAYRLTAQGAGDLVDTFAPVDPATVTTVAAQRAGVERWFDDHSTPLRPPAGDG